MRLFDDLLNAYSVALEHSGKPKEAAAAASEADGFGAPDPWYQQESRDLFLGRVLAGQGRFEEGISFCRKWISTFEPTTGKDTEFRLMIPMAECQRLLRSVGRDAEAAELEPRLKELRAKYDKPLGGNSAAPAGR